MGDKNVCGRGPAHAKVLELKKTQGALGARGGQRGWKAETEREQGPEPAGPRRLWLGVRFYSKDIGKPLKSLKLENYMVHLTGSKELPQKAPGTDDSRVSYLESLRRDNSSSI